MAYGDKRDCPKIDLYHMPAGDYLGSTTRAKTLKEAKARFVARTDIKTENLRAYFAQPKGQR